MRSTARRVAELEHEARDPASVHAIKIHEDDDESAREAAIDRYGRGRIKHEDMVVWLLDIGA